MKPDGPFYPLTAAQNILFYSQKFTLHKQVNNIFSLMLVEGELDFDTLRKAIGLAFEQCDSLHIRIMKVKGRIGQYILASQKPSIKLLDFTGRTRERMEKKLYALAAKPFYILNRPLSRFFLIRSFDGMAGIYLGVSHIVLDSWGICVLMKQIMALYEALMGNAPMPAPLFPHEPLLVEDLKYLESPQYEKDIDFWKQECARGQPWFTHVNGTGLLEAYRKKKHNDTYQGSSCFTLRTKALHETIVIPADKVSRMEAYCAGRNLPVQTLFMLAMRTCLSKRNDRQNDVSFYTIVARRGTLREKFSSGTHVHPTILRTIIGESSTFKEALEQIRARQSLLYRHVNLDMLNVMKLFQDAYLGGDQMASHQSVCMTFQPLKLTLGSGRVCHTKWYCNGAASQPFYLTIMDDDGSGGLRCYYEYQKRAVLRRTVLDFHEDLVRVIMAGIEHENITVGELLDL